MLSNNIQETTATTGSGNITLAGSSNNGSTFSSQFAINENFNYFIDDEAGNWECGVGYLSDASTLVRGQFLSSSTGSVIIFGAGTKQVFVGVSGEIVNQNYPANSTPLEIIPSAHFTSQTLTTVPLAADQQYFVPFLLNSAKKPTNMGIEITVAGGTVANKARIGIYSIGEDGYARAKIYESPDIDPSTTGEKKEAITGLSLKPGWHLFSVISDTPITIRANNYTLQTENCLGRVFSRKVSYARKANASWTSMLDFVDSWSLVNNLASPLIGVSHD